LVELGSKGLPCQASTQDKDSNSATSPILIFLSATSVKQVSDGAPHCLTS
jgi:hypothetical protein